MKTRHILGLALGVALLAAPATSAAPRNWDELAEVRDAARHLEAETLQLNQFAWGRAGRSRPHQENVLRNFTRLHHEARDFRSRVERDGWNAGQAYVRWQQLWDAFLDSERALRVLDRGDLWYEFRDVEFHMSRLDRFYDARRAGFAPDRDRNRAPLRSVAPSRSRVVRPVVVERPVVRRVVVVDDDDRDHKVKVKAKGKPVARGHRNHDEDEKRGKGHRKHGG